MAIEEQVATHYGLVQTVLTALTASGADIDHQTTADLAGADEFHLGGRAATVWFATELSLWVGLAVRATFRQGSALDLPFANGSFDGAYTVHVAMNIADKPRLFAEARRVLKPGSRFGILDLMRTSEDEIP